MAAESRVCQREAHKGNSRPDRRVSALAARQWGVVSLDELRACGLDRNAVRTRVARGWLHAVHRGVYAVGHVQLPTVGRFLAAVKACGAGAVLSHFAAAALLGFVRWDRRLIEVTVAGNATRTHPGLRVHKTATLQRADWVIRDGIPVTSPARTLVDLAAYSTPRDLRRAVREALAHKRVSLRQLIAAKTRLGPRRGSAVLAEVLSHAAPTRSELEDVVLDLILGAGFRKPDVNVSLRLNGRVVIPDFRWPAQRVVVEADSATWHGNALARQDDAERQALLEAHGERVVRVSWDDAVCRPGQTVDRLRLAFPQ
jgi:predicted transcriptional regulator of viral defense system